MTLLDAADAGVTLLDAADAGVTLLDTADAGVTLLDAADAGLVPPRSWPASSLVRRAMRHGLEVTVAS